MLIGIHAKFLSEAHPTGVGKYARKLLEHMLLLPETREHRFRLYSDARYALHVTRYSSVEVRTLRAPLLWTQARLGWELAWRAPDIFFTPQHVLPCTAPKRSTVTVHGLEFERYPQYYPWNERVYLRQVTRDAARRAACIIAVSQTTKNDLMELYRVPEEKIAVVYHGTPAPLAQFPIPNFQFPNISGAPYFLYIGRIEKKKNVDGVVRAFEIARERHGLPHKLVLVGSDGHGAKEIRSKILDSKPKNDIEIMGYVAEEQKWELLRGAEALLLPSWYEGFGLPILEAQSVGIPVITSNISAMPEVAGSGAFYIDPADPESVAQAMQKVASDEGFREGLIKKGLENAGRFSWEKCAMQTLAVLQNI